MHALGSTHLGQKGHFECGCPIRASAGSVDSLNGKIAIFRDLGHGSEWNQALIWDLIVSVPDHCLSFYFECRQPSCGHECQTILKGSKT